MIQNCMSEQQRRNAVQILLTLDKKDYEEGMPVFEKYSTRGVIIRDGKLQHNMAVPEIIKFSAEVWNRARSWKMH